MPDASCAVPECGRPVYCKSLCDPHYHRKIRTGRVGGPIRNRINGSPARRFWPKVDKNGPIPEYRPDLGPCWLWTAYVDPKGYGMFRLDGRMHRAHRIAWMLTHGAMPPDDLQLDHLCRVKSCVRWTHLEIVTNQENCARAGFVRWLTECSEGHPMTSENVRTTRTGIRVCRTCTPDKRADFDTHCANGHEWTSDNTIVVMREDRRRGKTYEVKRCRRCQRDAMRKHRARRPLATKRD